MTTPTQFPFPITSSIEVTRALGWLPDVEATKLLVLAGRVGAMLTRLIQRHAA